MVFIKGYSIKKNRRGEENFRDPLGQKWDFAKDHQRGCLVSFFTGWILLPNLFFLLYYLE